MTATAFPLTIAGVKKNRRAAFCAALSQGSPARVLTIADVTFPSVPIVITRPTVLGLTGVLAGSFASAKRTSLGGTTVGAAAIDEELTIIMTRQSNCL